jgi:hypothetical protein
MEVAAGAGWSLVVDIQYLGGRYGGTVEIGFDRASPSRLGKALRRGREASPGQVGFVLALGGPDGRKIGFVWVCFLVRCSWLFVRSSLS